MSEPETVSILVVDDLPEKILVYRSILEEVEVEIVAANSGPDALKQILRKNFAVILLDVYMPGMDGFETAMLIRKRAKSAHTPIIFITSYYNDDLRTHRGYAHGAVDYILAPVEPEILKAKVKVFVELFRLHRQVERRAAEQISLAEEKAKRIAAEAANRNSAFLAQASRVLANSLDIEETLLGLGKLGVPFLADLSVTCVANRHSSYEDDSAQLGNGQPEPDCPTASGQSGSSDYICRTEWVHRDCEGIVCNQSTQSLPPMPLKVMEALKNVLAGGSKEIIPYLEPNTEVNTLGRMYSPFGEFHWRSVTILPLSVRDKLLGCVLLAQGNSGRNFSLDDVILAEDLACRGAIALDNAMLVRDIREADRRKDEFLAMLAHELRNPLAPIGNAVEILRLAEGQEPRIIRARDMIDRQTRHLIRLVDDLLDVSRITRGKIRLQPEVFDLSTALLGAVESCRPLMEARDQQFSLSLPEQPIWIEGDPARMVQIFSNLLNNAAKYTEDEGSISLTAQLEENQAVVRVRDSGEGIPPEMLSSIFEPFVQLHGGAERTQGGLGIGLTLVRRLIELHGGSVSAHSQGQNQGSEFVVRLPAVEPRPNDTCAIVTTSPVAQKLIVAVPPPSDLTQRVRH
jgi:signal transduction histidine kinase/DNA-binding NarL/FixJ family response regulator